MGYTYSSRPYKTTLGKSSSNYKDDVMKKNAWRSIARELKKTDKKKRW